MTATNATTMALSAATTADLTTTAVQFDYMLPGALRFSIMAFVIRNVPRNPVCLMAGIAWNTKWSSVILFTKTTAVDITLMATAIEVGVRAQLIIIIDSSDIHSFCLGCNTEECGWDGLDCEPPISSIESKQENLATGILVVVVMATPEDFIDIAPHFLRQLGLLLRSVPRLMHDSRGREMVYPWSQSISRVHLRNKRAPQGSMLG